MNLYPARRGIRPEYGNITDDRDILRLHKIRPLRHRQALACAHALFDIVSQAPFLAASLKFMYRYLTVTTSLNSEGQGTNYEKVLSEHFVREHLYYAVEMALLTKKHLQQKRSWRLDPCIPYGSIRFSLHTVCDGSWGCLSGAASVSYLI